MARLRHSLTLFDAILGLLAPTALNVFGVGLGAVFSDVFTVEGLRVHAGPEGRA